MRTININKVRSALKKAGINAVKGPRSARSGQFTPVKPKPHKPSIQVSKQKTIPKNSNAGLLPLPLIITRQE